MQNKKKILFLINNLSIGGAERVLINTVNALDNNKYDITLKTVSGSGALKQALNPDIKFESMINIKNPFLNKVFVYAIGFILHPKFVHKLFFKKKYDIEAAFLEGVPTKIISGAPGGTKKYAWVHIDFEKSYNYSKMYKNEKEHLKVYKSFDKVLCVSKDVKAGFEKRLGKSDNLDVAYNVIDDEEIKAKSRENANINKDSLLAVTVGRLEPQKGYDRLIRIHKRLLDEGYDYKLMFVGDGSQREMLENYVEKNGIADKTIFSGYTENPYKYMSAADLMVFSSYFEGFSTVVTEALILGKPCVSTECAGTGELLGDSEFGLVTENSDEALYEGFKKMIESEELRKKYTESAKLRGQSFTKKERIARIEKLFD